MSIHFICCIHDNYSNSQELLRNYCAIATTTLGSAENETQVDVEWQMITQINPKKCSLDPLCMEDVCGFWEVKMEPSWHQNGNRNSACLDYTDKQAEI